MTHDHISIDPDALLSEVQAAALLGFTPRALQAWRQRGCGPRFVCVSARAIRYRRCDLIAWSKARLRTSTSDASEQRENNQ